MNEQNETAEGIFIRMPPAAPAYWLGARVMAVLAFPPAPGKPSTWRDAEAMFGRGLMLHLMANDPDWGEREQLLVPRHALLGADRYALLKSQAFEKRFHDRMGAAHVAWPLFEEADRIANGQPRLRRRSVGIDQRIKRTQGQEYDRRDILQTLGISAEPRFQMEPSNFDNRVLRASLPVLHIAVALASMIDESQRKIRNLPQYEQDTFPIDASGPQIGFLHLLAQPALAQGVIDYAQFLEVLLPHLSKLRLPPQKVVRLRQR